MNILKTLAIAFTCAATLTACDDDKKSGIPDISGAFQTIVTYAGADESGSSFTVTEPGTTRLSTFTSTISLTAISNGSVQPGQRVLIYYRNSSGKRYESGPIQFLGYSTVKGGKADAKPQADISPLRVDPTEVDRIELSGTYLDVVLTAAGGDGSLFDVYFDEATVDQAQPRAYVVFRSSNTSSANHVFVGSFDISDVWSKSTCESIVVYYGQGKDTSRKEVFPKPGVGVKPMD